MAKKRQPRKQWKPYEIELIKDLLPICSYRQISEYLGVSHPVLYNYVTKKLKLSNENERTHRRYGNPEVINQYLDKYNQAKRKWNSLNKSKQCTGSDTLCWTCDKSCGGYDCEWANGEFIPVPGWDATPTKIKCRHSEDPDRAIDSFIVHSCPKYLPEAPHPANNRREILNKRSRRK